MFTGGSQFAFIGVIAGGGTLGAATTAASLLGIRNAVYGVQLNALLRPRAAVKPLMAQLTIDESTATAVAQPDTAEQRRGFWTAGVGVWIMWNLFTLVGALLGSQNGDPAAVIKADRRVRIGSGVSGPGTALWIEVTELDEQTVTDDVRALATEYKQVTIATLQRRDAWQVIDTVEKMTDPSALADAAGWAPYLTVEQKRQVLETPDVVARLELLIDWNGLSIIGMVVRIALTEIKKQAFYTLLRNLYIFASYFD